MLEVGAEILALVVSVGTLIGHLQLRHDHRPSLRRDAIDIAAAAPEDPCMTKSLRLTFALGLAMAAVLVLAPSGPAGQIPPCDCASVKAVATSLSTIENPNQPASFSLTVKATVKCKQKTGSGCSGELVVQPAIKTPPPTATDAQLVTPTSPTIRCAGRCLFPTSRTVRLEFRSAQDLKFTERANETWIFRLKPFCNRAKGKVAGTTIRISVVFGSGGGFDSAKSDLNANGIRDGDE